jgi:leucyl aminopeptidase
MIKTTVKNEQITAHKTDCLIVPCVEVKKPAGVLPGIDKRLGGGIAQAFQAKRFEGKLNQTLLLNTPGKMNAQSILLVGVGPAKEVTDDKLRQAAGTAAKLAEKSCCRKVSFFLDNLATSKTLAKDSEACSIAEGAGLGLYHFDHCKSAEQLKDQNRVQEIVLLTESQASLAGMRRAADRAKKICAAVWATRDLILYPSNYATPSFLAKTAKGIAKAAKLSCKVLGPKEMKKLGMGAILGVSQGSDQPPAFIILEYSGGKKSQAPVAIVGKGITFDTGGISLKPSANMGEMKMDMSGAAVTLGILQLVASLKLPINVVGLVAAAENMPGGSAINPGDVLTSMAGKTIEVLNTDAEGRLVLADALCYASRYKPRAVIDLATLTGAVIIALGSHAAAVLGNDSDLTQNLIDSGTATGERVWELPLWEEYEKAMKSDIADLKNIASPGVGAGTITGAAFLKAFAGEWPWAHIDIASTSWSGEEKPYAPKGASGFGVRLLLHYLEHLSGGSKRKITKKK